MVRLFIAVTLPQEALEACARETRRVQEALGPLSRGVRFPRAEGLHFTLKFLGWTPEGSVDSVRKALEAAASEGAPFTLTLKGLEAFPSIRRPRVVFLDVVEGGPPMIELAAAVERNVAPLGFPTEARGFTPHVTLARIKDPKTAARIGERVAALPALEVARTRVGKVSLMQSELSPGGSRYSALAEIALCGRA
jgi:2'-5' RNA ligase